MRRRPGHSGALPRRQDHLHRHRLDRHWLQPASAYRSGRGDHGDRGDHAAEPVRSVDSPTGVRWVLQTDFVTSAEVTKTEPFTVTYRIHKNAQWSDGLP